MGSTKKVKRRGRRPKKPRRQFPGIEAVWSGGRWQWRGRMSIDGRPKVGPVRELQQDAHDDNRKMKREAAKLPSKVLTLAQALDAAIALDRQKGSYDEATIARQHESHRAYLEKFWVASETAVTDITKSEVVWFIREAREKGRHDNTLLQKDLPLLAAALRAAGVDDTPVHEAREQAKVHYVKPKMALLLPGQLAKILQRIRTEEFRDKRGGLIHIRARERHADILQVVAMTGVRPGELGRITADNVDMEQRTIRVAVAKDRTHPRDLEIVPELVEPVRRLVAEALRRHLRGDNPGKLLVPGGMNYVANLCRRWKDRLGVKVLSGRALRHTFLTGVAYLTKSKAEIRDVGGHSSLKSSDRYVDHVASLRGGAARRFARSLGLPAADAQPGE